MTNNVVNIADYQMTAIPSYAIYLQLVSPKGKSLDVVCVSWEYDPGFTRAVFKDVSLYVRAIRRLERYGITTFQLGRSGLPAASISTDADIYITGLSDLDSLMWVFVEATGGKEDEYV